MDLQYLLWLQGFREAGGEDIVDLFLNITDLAANLLIVLAPFIIYWCIDKHKGEVIITGFSLGFVTNQILKDTVCCYRPWIRDAAIQPPAEALKGATGYSFPSGHTQIATTVYGGIASQFRKNRVLVVVCVVIIALVMFSRNFLGVHTPQDVLVACAESLLALWLAPKIVRWASVEGRDLKVLIGSLVFVALAVAYILLKPYPLDYSADGQLLVDPEKMMKDSIIALGLFAGVVLGWFLQRRFVKFSTDGLSVKQRIVRGVVGVIVVMIFFAIFHWTFISELEIRAAYFFTGFTLSLGALWLAPFVFTKIEARN